MKKLGSVCGNYLAEKSELNEEIWVLDGDLADSDGAEEFMLKNPDKFIASGIAEQNMVSMAAGLATTEKLPWVFSFAAFLCYRAYDQIRVCISQTGLPVVLVGSHSGGCSGRNGKTHTALNDIAVMASLPRINVWTPADEDDTKFAVDEIIRANKPAYLRLPRDPQPSLHILRDLRKEAVWIGAPSKIALISYGLSTRWALEAQKILSDQGIQIGVLHFCKIWPLETESVFKLLQNLQIGVVIEDHYEFGGLSSFLRNLKLGIEFETMCWPSEWSGQSGTALALLDYFQLSPRHIAKKVLCLL